MTQPGPALVGESAKQEAYLWIESLNIELIRSDTQEIRCIARLMDYARRHPDPELTDIALSFARIDTFENRMHRELNPMRQLVANA